MCLHSHLITRATRNRKGKITSATVLFNDYYAKYARDIKTRHPRTTNLDFQTWLLVAIILLHETMHVIEAPGLNQDLREDIVHFSANYDSTEWGLALERQLLGFLIESTNSLLNGQPAPFMMIPQFGLFGWHTPEESSKLLVIYI